MRLIPIAIAAAIALTAAGGSDRVTLRPFVGKWSGHTRSVVVDRAGVAQESISDGCCDLVVRLTTRLSHPRRVGDSIVATAIVVRARVFDRSAFGKRAPPRAGDRGRFVLKRGIVSEGLTQTVYCNSRTARLGRCGA